MTGLVGLIPRRRSARLGLAAAGGLLAAAGQAPLGAWWLALPGYALGICVIAATRGWRRRAAAGWIFGAVFFSATMFWIVEPFMVEPERHGWMAPFALVFLSAGLALFWALGGALSAAVGGGGPGVALALVAAEALRGHLFGGFPWALPSHVWVDTPMAQAASVVGPWGLLFLTLGALGLPVTAPRPALAAVGVLALGAALWLWGEARLGLPRPSPDDGRPIVRIVQPNAEQHLKWRPEHATEYFARQLELSRAPGPNGSRPDLVVWPETAIPWLLNDAEVPLEMMAAAAGAPVAFGVQRREGARYFNSLAVMGADGTVKAVYDKAHLVPFGEFVPLGDLAARFGIHGLAAQEGAGYTPGPGPEILSVPGVGSFRPLVCYEAIFPAEVAATPARPDFLLQVTNDGWFGRIAGPQQHLAQARMRAIELGLPLVRAANTGISAVFGPKGEVLGMLGIGEVGHLDRALPRALPPTIYARVGDMPFWLVLGGCLVLAGAIRRKRH